MPDATLPLPPRADRMTGATRMIAVWTAFALIVLGLGWELSWAPTGHGTLFIKVLPLVLALPGLMRFGMRTYRWLSLAVWLYVCEGAVRVFDPGPVRLLAGIEIALGLVLFAACATHVRWRLAIGRRHAADAAR